MKEFCRVLGKVMSRPSYFKIPAVILKIFFGEASEVILNGAQVIPGRTIDARYKFKFEKAENALKNLFYG